MPFIIVLSILEEIGLDKQILHFFRFEIHKWTSKNCYCQMIENNRIIMGGGRYVYLCLVGLFWGRKVCLLVSCGIILGVEGMYICVL